MASKLKIRADERVHNEVLNKEFSRTAFLKGGGALIVGFSALGAGLAGKAHADLITYPAAPPSSLDGWIAIHADNTVTVLSGVIEMGQGTTTGLRQVAAEELDIAVEQIRWVRPETGVTPSQGPTYGSRGIRFGSPGIRAAAAYAKQALLGLASAQLGVPVASLTVDRGVVSGGGRSVSYGALLGDKRFNVTMPTLELAAGAAPAKSPSAYKVVGTRVPRVDIPDTVSGAHTYLHNVRVPGMLHGRVVRPRGQAAYGTGATVISIDESSIKNIPGVRVIRRNGFVGVVAEREYDAIQAAAQLKVKWEGKPTLPSSGNIFKQMREQDAAGQTTNTIRASAGDVGAGLAGAAKVYSATYSHAYQMHAPIAPHSAIADVQPGRALVLCSSQDIYSAQNQSLPPVLNMPANQITVKYWESGGTFGSSCYNDAAQAAAIMSQEVGKPVRVQFMRWDEHGWTGLGQAMLADVRAGVDANGKIVAYDHTAWGLPYIPYNQPESSRELSGVPIPIKDLPNPPFGTGPVDTSMVNRYTIPNHRVTGKRVDPLNGYLMAAPLRLPSGPQNTFISEQTIDELSRLANMDPIAFRKHNIGGTSLARTRALTVLDTIAEAARWQPKVTGSALSAGDVVTGRGVAWTGNQATIADIEVNKKTGRIVAKHLYGVADAGLIINPALVESQIMGNLMMGASRGLFEAVAFSKIRVTSTDWVSYPILRFKDAPKVTTIAISRSDLPPEGAGEASHGTVLAAIANAFVDATGVRIRQAPLTPARVRAALKGAGVT
jgi:CO/xanthine dehydrogenase Mo-binding subunit